ncbi:MAG: adenylyl-sulfate kinase [Lawsonibacter sp.]|nr:adenylyl-sulfate kinase [Lawsonibacter sp.]
MNEKGTLYWVTGLSGAGKTTVGTLLYQYLRCRKPGVVLLDGDMLRAMAENHDYTDEGRERMAYQNMRLFRLLTEQGIDVVGCVIGMREKYRAWNRENIPNYKEIYLKVSLEELVNRDSKGLYRRALNRETTDVYGIDLKFEEPERPDVVVENEGLVRPEDALKTIVAALGLEKRGVEA